MSDSVLLEQDKRGVATLTLNRPAKHNAFDDCMITSITAQLETVAQDASVRVLILSANGKSFSAGADLGWMQRMANYSEAENLADAKSLAAMLQRLNTLPQPTIARVQGAAFGGAVGLVSCCDIAVGTEKARFCFSEVKIGLIPATISPYVIAAIGERAARRFFTTAEVISAERAEALGLLSEVVSEAELDTAVDGLVGTILQNGPGAVQASKSLVLDYAQRPIDSALIADSCERIARVRVSSEGQQGLSAFFDKSAPPRAEDDV
ncbi:MAG: enoyl-CoA hydratase/isomerase family protein [Pseudomonadota bacterium]